MDVCELGPVPHFVEKKRIHTDKTAPSSAIVKQNKSSSEISEKDPMGNKKITDLNIAVGLNPGMDGL